MRALKESTRLIYFILGWISLILGFIGIFLPLLPTTPFLLLTAFLWARSSKRWYHWLMTQKTFGPIIRDWESRGVIRKKAKVLATVLMLPLYLYALFTNYVPIYGKITMLLIGSTVLIFIWTRPSE